MMNIYENFGISRELAELAEKIQKKVNPLFEGIEKIEEENQLRVLEGFKKNRVSDVHFSPTSGYGYDDTGRDTLDRVYADVFGCEAAYVRQNIVSGTHAIASMIFAVLCPGDILLSATGKPYDTLCSVIGIQGNARRTFADIGIGYRQVELDKGTLDIPAILAALDDKYIKGVLLQRSRGYDWRPAINVSKIREVCAEIKAKRPDVIIMVDNCYGEFTEVREPVSCGADVMAGSLIKNPGGGLAPSGGYIAGRADIVQLCADRITAPGIGLECGASLVPPKSFYQGFFMAPHIVAESIKAAIFCGALFEELGYETSPSPDCMRTDIIQAVRLGTAEKVIAFCRGVQSASPVDAFVSPTPSPMPGYTSEVIMAAGTFVQGASIEVSADAPIRPPYIAYMQGGLTYKSAKAAILSAAQMVIKEGQ